jgi:septal ring factor EnvC (AmiA/AmiB activator)
MSDKYVNASSTPSTALPLPNDGKQERRRKRGGLFSSLFNSVTPSRTQGKRNVMPTVLALLLWGGLAYGGYAFAMHTLDKQQQFVNQRITQVQEKNQEQMKAMGDQLTLVQDEMAEVVSGLTVIQEELQLTGETIGGTDKTKQALQQRIDQLNTQLVELKASLKKLEDAARAW